MSSRMIARLVCLLLFAGGALSQEVLCNQICKTQGQYCRGDDCLSCELGTFQNKILHQETKCQNWTIKPQGSNYVKVKNGTAISDHVWECRKGYVEIEYLPSSFKCEEVQPTTPPISTSEATTTDKTTSPEHVTSTSTASQSKETTEKSAIGTIVGYTIAAVIGVAILVSIFYFCWLRPRNLRRAQEQRDRDPEANRLVPDSGSKFNQFFGEITNRLGIDISVMFIRCLNDPSGKFKADNIMEFEYLKDKKDTAYLTRSLVRWANLNERIDCGIIVDTLKFVGRPNLLRELGDIEGIFIDEHHVINEVNGVTVGFSNSSGDGAVGFSNSSGDGAVGFSNSSGDGAVRFSNSSGDGAIGFSNSSGDGAVGFSNSSGDGAAPLAAQNSLSPSDRYRLFYFLATKLSVSEAHSLLDHLPKAGNNFIPKIYINTLGKENWFNNNFSQTLQEWWLRDPTNTLRNINDALTSIERPDIVGDETFKTMSGSKESPVNSVPNVSTIQSTNISEAVVNDTTRTVLPVPATTTGTSGHREEGIDNVDGSAAENDTTTTAIIRPVPATTAQTSRQGLKNTDNVDGEAAVNNTATSTRPVPAATTRISRQGLKNTHNVGRRTTECPTASLDNI